ncbi:peptidyl-prolyl cis-trans isomerase [Geoanaerobacter pelophilus]|uniref:peptidylprolyl isomerase n=1 Tax=Geoanaerobacter pelophilus TaxID=60036 RepID=A0ABQ0MEC0_9BACT|nr:peptidylprolyl isomerase [Geoanaerobacter pelophilus]GAW65456.1 peptidyl-prolyl cis-trans isomerase [Geoanaerobacter pelophilus]
MHYHHAASKSLLVLCAATMLFSGCAGARPAAVATPVPAPLAAQGAPSAAGEVVARVNGKEIHRNELERSKKILMAGQPAIPPYLLKELEKQALDQLIGAELMYQAGLALEITDLDRMADAKLAQIKSGFKDQKVYEKELAGISMTEEMLREYSRRDLVIANLVNTRIAPDLKVDDQEIEKFYAENPERFEQKEQVRASHILIGCDAKATADEKKKAREKAEMLLKELKGGADFAKLAKENSTCPSATNGGDLGYFGRGRMAPTFEEAAFALKTGELSNVVETGYGYHLVKQTDRIKAEKVSLAAAREKIAAYLKSRKTGELVASFIGQARQEAKVELLLK